MKNRRPRPGSLVACPGTPPLPFVTDHSDATGLSTLRAELRRKLALSTYRAVAAEYGVNPGTVWRIVNSGHDPQRSGRDAQAGEMPAKVEREF